MKCPFCKNKLPRSSIFDPLFNRIFYTFFPRSYNHCVWCRIDFTYDPKFIIFSKLTKFVISLNLYRISVNLEKNEVFLIIWHKTGKKFFEKYILLSSKLATNPFRPIKQWDYDIQKYLIFLE